MTKIRRRTNTRTRLYKRLGERIYSLRTAQGISQDDLAQAAGVARTTITHIENARHSVQFDTLYRLAEALHTTPQELLPPSEADNFEPIPEGKTRPGRKRGPGAQVLQDRLDAILRGQL